MSEKVYDYSKIPKKRMAAVAIILNEKDEVLIVKPTYRDDWLIPGGIVEESESPHAACIREVKEEIGLDLKLQGLICVDYLNANEEMTEGIHFVFYGGVLPEEQIKKITLADGELSEYRFVSVSDSINVVSKINGRRMPKCVKAAQEGTTVYMEDQEQIL